MKLVRGIGINDADYNTGRSETVYSETGVRSMKRVWTCPFYVKWTNMLERCYSATFKVKYPSYEGCSVCDDWIYFSKFKSWMETQDWQGKQLDKDILAPNNKVYGPETCVFVSSKVNHFLLQRQADRGDYIIGAHWYPRHNQFKAQIKCESGTLHLGYFDTEYEAHEVWHKAKLKLAQELIDKEGLTGRTACAIMDRVTDMKEEYYEPII